VVYVTSTPTQEPVGVLVKVTVGKELAVVDNDGAGEAAIQPFKLM
jgi:hypothetical protein